MVEDKSGNGHHAKVHGKGLKIFDIGNEEEDMPKKGKKKKGKKWESLMPHILMIYVFIKN